MLEIKNLTFYNLINKLKSLFTDIYSQLTTVNSKILALQQEVPDDDQVLSLRVVVKDESQLQDIDSTKEYFIDGEVEITQPIVVPSGGILLNGYGASLSRLKSTTNNLTMFTSPVGGSGDVNAQKITIEVSGTGSRVFAITADTGLEAAEFTDVNFENCTSRGYIDGYRQGLESNIALFGGTPTLEFRGTWLGGFRIDTLIARGLINSNYSLYTSDASQVFNTRFGGNPNIELPSNVKAFTFIAGNFAQDGLLQISGANFQGTGTVFGGIDHTNTRVKVKDSVGVTSTYVGGFWNLTTQTATTFSASNTYTKSLGTTTYGNLVWFTNGGGNNTLTDNTTVGIDTKVYFIGSFTGGNAVEYGIKIRQWDDSATQYIDLAETFFTTNGGGAGNRAENVAMCTSYFSMSKNDRIEMWVKNSTGTSSLTMLLNSKMIVEEA